MRKQNKSFISDLDIFLKKFDQKHAELSASQILEIKKHERIAKLRDEVQEDDKEQNLWKEF